MNNYPISYKIPTIETNNPKERKEKTHRISLLVYSVLAIIPFIGIIFTIAGVILDWKARSTVYGKTCLLVCAAATFLGLSISIFFIGLIINFQEIFNLL